MSEPRDSWELPSQIRPLPLHPIDILKGPTCCPKMHFIASKCERCCHVSVIYKIKNSLELKIKRSLMDNYTNVTNIFIFFQVLVDSSFINHEKMKWFNVKFTWLCKRQTEDYILLSQNSKLIHKWNFQSDTNSKLYSFCWACSFNAHKSRGPTSLKFPFLNKMSMVRSFFFSSRTFTGEEQCPELSHNHFFSKSRILKKLRPNHSGSSISIAT